MQPQLDLCVCLIYDGLSAHVSPPATLFRYEYNCYGAMDRSASKIPAASGNSGIEEWCLLGSKAGKWWRCFPIPLFSCIINHEALYVTFWNCRALVSVGALSTVISHSSWLSLLTFLLHVVSGKKKLGSNTSCKWSAMELAQSRWWRDGGNREWEKWYEELR